MMSRWTKKRPGVPAPRVFFVPSYRTSVAYHFIHNAPPFRRNASSPAARIRKENSVPRQLVCTHHQVADITACRFFCKGFLPKGRHHAAHRFIHVCIVAASIIVNAARQFPRCFHVLYDKGYVRHTTVVRIRKFPGLLLVEHFPKHRCKVASAFCQLVLCRLSYIPRKPKHYALRLVF